MYKIEIYENKNGESEIKEYMYKLQSKNNKDSKIKFNKIVAYIRMLEQEGLKLGVPYIKHIYKDIWELRPLKDRIFFARYSNSKFVLLSIFTKKTQKTPLREIEKAQKILEDYEKRSDKNE